jgi:hypothetical protein
LKRDDPKALTIRQYESIASSAAIRRVLATHPSLKKALTSVDGLHGDSRESAFRHLVSRSQADVSFAPPNGASRHECSAYFEGEPDLGEEEIQGFKQLAEAIELAVRTEKQGSLGLDWEDPTPN